MKTRLLAIIALALLFAFSTLHANALGSDLTKGAVFYPTNTLEANGGNTVMAFARDESGALTLVGEFPTGGNGNEEGIITSGQNAAVLDTSSPTQYLFVINAGANSSSDRNGSLSVFRVEPDELVLTDVVSTLGPQPRSVARDRRTFGNGTFRNIATVVNAGTGSFEFQLIPGLAAIGVDTDPLGRPVPDPVPVSNFVGESISSYSFNENTGSLTPIPGSRRFTRDRDGDPAQISYINDGRQVVISQRKTFFALGTGLEDDNIEVFRIDQQGRTIGQAVVSETTGNDPFGFTVFDNRMYLTHGSFQQIAQGGTSVISIDRNTGVGNTVIPNKPDGQSDTCWNVISDWTETPMMYNSAFFNSGITIQNVNPDGTLTDGDLGSPVRRRESSAPDSNCMAVQDPPCARYFDDAGGLDMGLSKGADKQFLYVVNAPFPFAQLDDNGNVFYPNLTSIAVFEIDQATGDLTALDNLRVSGLPGSGFGLATH